MTRATETTQTTGKCIRCGRTLRAGKSIADGMGRTCRAKVRKTAEVIDLGAFRDAKGARDKAAELVEQGGIVPAGRPALFLAVSSDGANTYLVDTLEGSCSCKGFAHQGRCFHLVAAALITAQPTAAFAAAA